MDQVITSAKTSVNSKKLPAIFKKIECVWTHGAINVDYGGGKYDIATDYLQEKNILNLIYDPFNRSAEYNAIVLTTLRYYPADTATISNVLNVIREKEIRKRVTQHVYDLLKPEGKAFFSFYAGDRSGVGKETSKGWQENRIAKSYIVEIEEVFPVVFITNSIVFAEKR
ncbi:MAG: hypothetical protein WC511_03165 [Candidatus Pacearchaeota archaeon]